MESRRRKLKSEAQDGSDSEPRQPRTKRPTPGRRYILYLSVLGSLLLGYVLISYDSKPAHLGSRALDSLALSFSLQKPFYVVVVDAGSTGSRALAFRFHESLLTGNLVLDDELFVETKPGLSAYAEHPSQAAESLNVLLEKANAFVPEAERKNTPLTMKATAGLRLLPGHKAQDILAACKQAFQKSGYQLSPNSVSLMEGSDEGIFSWFTVNFLLERFAARGTAATVAALDLGGGSTQVTFALDQSPGDTVDSVFSVNVFDRNVSVFTHSYLGMGLMAARKEILARSGTAEPTDQPDRVLVRSECVNPIVSTEWNYGGKVYLVKGPVNATHKLVKTQNFAGGEENRPIVKFSECLKHVEQYVGGIRRPTGLRHHEIYAFSYYFERATEVGLVDPFFGGVVPVSAFLKQATEACDYPNIEQPFICLDLTFIYVLLRDGFGLEPSTKLYLYKKINGHELSWALGAAFNIIQNGF